jgi:Mitochondrial carrier protein
MSAATLAQGAQLSEPVSSHVSTDHKPTRKRRRGSIAEKEPRRSDSIAGALTRSILGVVALLFRAPIRLYRPVKLSSWNILETLAKREGKTLNLRFLRSIIRREKGSFLLHLLGPPLLFNTLIGVALFETYSLTESYLLNKFHPNRPGPRRDSAGRRIPQWSPFWIVGISGLAAGAGQALVSAPLDNVRTILSARPPSQSGKHGGQHHHRAHISWRSVLRAALLPFAPESTRKAIVKKVKSDAPRPRWSWLLPSQLGANRPKITTKQRKEYWEAQLKRWRGGIHGAGLVLSLVRDSVGFSAFFLLFEVSFFRTPGPVSKMLTAQCRSPEESPTQSRSRSTRCTWSSIGRQHSPPLHLLESSEKSPSTSTMSGRTIRTAQAEVSQGA